MEIFDKISALTKSTADKKSNKMTISKLNAGIKTLQSDISAQKLKIGEYFWERLKDDEAYEDGIADVFAKVKSLSAEVASAEAEINAILESERAAELARASSKPLASAMKCPLCGAPNPPNSKFCSACGGSTAVLSGKECAKCGTRVAIDASFCPECGASVAAAEALVCAKCGTALAEGDKFCMNCGAKRERVEEAPVEEVEKQPEEGPKCENSEERQNLL